VLVGGVGAVRLVGREVRLLRSGDAGRDFKDNTLKMGEGGVSAELRD
jgi:hypothetical protein